MRSALVVVAVFAAGCEIANTDPLPDIGATCIVADGKCSIEHTCRPNAPGDAEGLCAPVASYGVACDAAKAVSHPAGREGTDEERAVLIDDVADLALLEDVRSVTGGLQVFRPGAERVDLPDLCGLRDLQRVGGSLAVADLTLTTLDGLQSITSVGAGLAVLDNVALTSLDALANVVDVTTRTIEVNDVETTYDVVIAGNLDLTDEVVDAFAADLEARAGRDLDIVACNNDGADCAGDELDLVQLLIATGGRGD